MSIDFYSTENMSLLWSYIELILKTTAPGVMMWFAVIAVGFLLTIVVKAFRSANKDEDEEEVEIKRY